VLDQTAPVVDGTVGGVTGTVDQVTDGLTGGGN
jgi:hypothetical protein